MTNDYISTGGPVCPYCRHQETPDEGYYYSDSLCELECGDCGKAYAVEVYNETSWTTRPKSEAA
jgi:transposase-like protein